MKTLKLSFMYKTIACAYLLHVEIGTRALEWYYLSIKRNTNYAAFFLFYYSFHLVSSTFHVKTGTIKLKRGIDLSLTPFLRINDLMTMLTHSTYLDNGVYIRIYFDTHILSYAKIFVNILTLFFWKNENFF